MPRTKAGRPRPSLARLSTSRVQEVVAAVNVRVNFQRERLKDSYNRQLEHLNEVYQSLLTKYAQDLDKTMGELRAETKENIVSDVMNSLSTTKSRSLVSTSSKGDDGYVTDGSSVQSKPTRQSQRVSRSLTRYNMQTSKLGAMGPPNKGSVRKNRSSSVNSAMRVPRYTKQRYHTPMNRGHANIQYPTITPKVAPNTPLALLRRPRQGEMVVSLSGSPLLVNSITGVDEKANCNIPLSDGTIISLLPNKLKDSHISLPFNQMKPETMQELKTLQANLSAYLKTKNRL